MIKVLVTGAGGFIGHHLTSYLVGLGYWVRGVDIKLPQWEPSKAQEFLQLDLRDFDACKRALTIGPNAIVDEVYHLAADMGGIGYIQTHKADIVRNSTRINLNMLDAFTSLIDPHGSRHHRFFFSSSACVYPGYLQTETELDVPLREENAYPADPEDGYGWEKLYVERLCRHYREDYGLETRIARFHPIFGPLGTYDGGREKAPAAICRKVALANDGDAIEVWGDGEQTRSFCYVSDCVEGVHRLMRSDHPDPVNIGSEYLVTINQLVDIVAKIAGKTIYKAHDLDKPQGVRGRNSDNTLCRRVLRWEPEVSLEEGLYQTYVWIWEQLSSTGQKPQWPTGNRKVSRIGGEM